jgi:hypothetical protein
VPVDACRVHETHDGRGTLARTQASRKEPIVASESYRP